MHWPRWGRNARIHREASAWAIRMRGPQANALRDEFETWRSMSPLHAGQYDDAVWMLQLATSAKRTPSPAMTRPPARSGNPRYQIAVTVAASIVAAAGGALLIERHFAVPGVGVTQYASTSTPREIALSDGSMVTLDAHSVAVTHFDGHVRALTLVSGHARFTVAHDAAHPFIVTAGDRQVTARGTVFEVALRGDQVLVVMREGVVEVTHRTTPSTAAPVRLVRGQTLVTAGDRDTVLSDTGNQASARSRPAGAPQRASLLARARVDGTDGVMVRYYDATPLATVLADANQGATKPIRVGALGLSGLHVEGRFEIGDTRAVARILAAALDLKLEDGGSSWILTRA